MMLDQDKISEFHGKALSEIELSTGGKIKYSSIILTLKSVLLYFDVVINFIGVTKIVLFAIYLFS